MAVPDCCPDGLDCPYFYQCRDDEDQYEDDQCPIEGTMYDHRTPLDKLIK